ncbi:MAG: hypothetical protein J6V73_04980 [Spirochaetaceae bacterium]|nr:hypothetical protein [Spirochaetaceae bacterium]
MMLKNIFLTMVMDKKAMKEVNSYKNSFFITALIVILSFQILSGLYSIKQMSITWEAKSIIAAIVLMLSVVLFNFLLGFVLYKSFPFKEQIKSPDLIFRTIISMNFVRPMIVLVGLFWKKNFLGFLGLIYDFFFIMNYMKANLEFEFSEKPLRKYVLIAFIISFVCLFFIFQFALVVIAGSRSLLLQFIGNS